MNITLLLIFGLCLAVAAIGYILWLLYNSILNR